MKRIGPKQISEGWVMFKKIDSYIHNQSKTTVTFINPIKHYWSEKEVNPKSLWFDDINCIGAHFISGAVV